VDVPQKVQPPLIVGPVREHAAKLVQVVEDERVDRKLDRRTGLKRDQMLVDGGNLIQLVVLGPQAPPVELRAEFQDALGLAGLDWQCICEYGHRRPPRGPPVNMLSVPLATTLHVSTCA
jgi:hypothetical protein